MLIAKAKGREWHCASLTSEVATYMYMYMYVRRSRARNKYVFTFRLYARATSFLTGCDIGVCIVDG